MSDDPATADAAPEPRANQRFPWAPAALCAASLAMAGWTWMRYSYAWDVAVSDFYDGVDDHASYDLTGTPRHPLEGRYVRLRGMVVFAQRLHARVTEYPGYCLCGVVDTLDEHRYVEVLLPGTRIAKTPGGWGSPETWGKGVVGEDVVFAGRFVGHGGLHSTTNDGSIQYAAIDTTASRLHHTSIAGLVVAAFVTFVFALYLRGWLRERTAAASA